MLKMIEQANMVTENYRLGALKRLGLAPEEYALLIKEHARMQA